MTAWIQSVDFTLLIPLWVMGVVAIGIVPGLVIGYRALFVNQRIDDMEASIWDGKSIRMYIALFTKEDVPKDPTREMLTAVIRREFLAVHSWRKYIVALIPLTIAVSVVVWVALEWIDARVGGATTSLGKLDDAVIMALVGAYTWSIYEILSRSRTRDLTPDVLLELTLRHLAAVPIGYAFSLLALDRIAASMAFASAAFPLRDVRLFVRARALKKLDQEVRTEVQGREGHLRVLVDGLSDATIARLEELNVVTYLDLAYVNPVRLMARTGFSLRLVLAWIDQGLLAVYAPAQKEQLAELGLPCALDAVEFYEAHCFDVEQQRPRDWHADEAVNELAKALKLPVVLIPEILMRVSEDPHVRFMASIWDAGADETVTAAKSG